MIAVWLVGPPSVVASATTSVGVQACRVGRGEVVGQQNRRHRGQRHAGLGQPAEFGDDAVADVAQIGDPLGHQPAELSEQVDELVDRGHHGARCRRTCVDELLGCAQPRAVLRQRRRRGQHLGRRAGGVCGAVAQPGGDGVGRRGEAGRLCRTLLLIDLGRRVHVVEYREAAGPDHRSVLNACDDGDALQNGARGEPAGGRVTTVTWAEMTRSCEADYKPTVDKSTHSGVKQHISTLNTGQNPHKRRAMYAEERQQAIASLVISKGRASVAELAETYDVTTETVRRDLAVLDRAGLVRRVHGGAVPVRALHLVEPGVGERENTRAEHKDAIAAAAAEFLPLSGASVLLDAGTTTGRIAAVLPTDRELTVVTNSVPIAARLAAHAVGVAAAARRPGQRPHPGRRRRAGTARAGHPARRHRLHRHQRHQRQARPLHPGQRRGRRQARHGRAAPTTLWWLPTRRRSAARTSSASPRSRSVDTLITDAEISDADRSQLTEQRRRSGRIA